MTVLSASLLLSGCGHASSDSGEYYAEASTSSAKSMSNDSYAAEEAEYGIYDTAGMYTEEYEDVAADSGSTEFSDEQVQNASETRKLIKTVMLSVETQNLEELDAFITAKTEGLGGYIESSYKEGNENSDSRSSRSASYTIRIPADMVDSFVDQVSGESNVISQNVNVDDITLQYVDTQSRKKALETERDALENMMKQADNVSDMIEIRSQLTEVQSDLESVESRLRVYDNQVSYSTVYVDVTQVVIYTPVEKKPALERIREGLAESLRGAKEDVEEALINFIIDLPYLIVSLITLILVLFVLSLLIRLFLRMVTGKSRKERRAERQAARAEKELTGGKKEKRRHGEKREAPEKYNLAETDTTLQAAAENMEENKEEN